MLLGLRKCSPYKPINCHGPSHKYYPLQPICYPTWVLTKNTHYITTKIGLQNYIIPTQSPTLFGLWEKPKESPKFQSPTTMWLIQSPTTKWLIQSPTNDVANSKDRYDASLFTKPVATQQYFTKSQNHFYKAKIPIWHLFSQSPNSYLASIFARPKF